MRFPILESPFFIPEMHCFGADYARSMHVLPRTQKKAGRTSPPRPLSIAPTMLSHRHQFGFLLFGLRRLRAIGFGLLHGRRDIGRLQNRVPI